MQVDGEPGGLPPWSPPRIARLALSSTDNTGAHVHPTTWEGSRPVPQSGPTVGYRMPTSGEPAPYPVT